MASRRREFPGRTHNECDDLDVAEAAEDHFGRHNDDIGAANLDAQEIKPANDQQARKSEDKNDAER